ncbi:hypothetical protein [Streptomyces sp. NPDC089919]|uniref:hypothetical protein n=1 Tax=Streptomyces sp. NPDC089919 TaxID=3155188 RepID=UPI00343D0277
MPNTADQLLSALEPLPFPARLALTARTGHRLAGDELAPLLAALDAGGAYERRTGALAAFAGRDAAFLADRLTDPDPVVAGYALRAARVLPVPDEALAAAYRDAPAALRHQLARVLAGGGRTALAERLVAQLRAQWGDAEAARLLPACGTPFVAAHLPALAHAVAGWTTLARRHPDPVLAHVRTELVGRAGGTEQQRWWSQHGTVVALLAPLRPLPVLDLLERYGPRLLPVTLHAALAAPAAADPERVIAWLTAPERSSERHPRPLPPAVLRRLTAADPRSLAALGRHWLPHQEHFTALVRALPPGRRPGFVDAVAAGAPGADPARAVLDLLPRERRWAEVRRVEPDTTDSWSWYEDLRTLSHGRYDEARPALLAAAGRADPEDRAFAWPLLVACAARDGSRAAIGDLLTTLGRLRNDWEPVRTAALRALAAVPPGLFDPADHLLLAALATDALGARDTSPAGRTALRTLAERVLAARATDPEPALRTWALETLERITGRTGTPEFGPLHRVLRRGQEHQVFEALRPWLEAAAARADFRLLLGLARALGPRARRMPALQDLLAAALERGDDAAFEEAVPLWLADPGSRDARVTRILALEPSAAVLEPVRRLLAERRTDLLDVLLDEPAPYGRFLVSGARPPLPELRAAGRWLPRQQRAAARLVDRAAADAALPLDDRAAAIAAAAAVPGLGFDLALRYADHAEPLLAEAALAALARTDRPQDALAVLLDRAGGDRARVAVYAAARAAGRTPPARLAPALGALLTGERPAKVTSRKEAVRLAARFLPPGAAVDLLSRAFHAPDRHPDVRAAVVRALPALLGEPTAWRLLTEAVDGDGGPADGAPADGPAGPSAVLEGLLEVTPWQLAEEYRARYAAVVDAAYAPCLAGLEGFGAYGPLCAVGAWCRYDSSLADRIAATAADLAGRDCWQMAAWVLRDLACSELAHPAGGAEPGSALHTAVATLLAALRAPGSEDEALADRDLPALQRLRTLTALDSGEGGRTDVYAAMARQLAAEPLLAAERAGALRSLAEGAAGADELGVRLRDLAEALDGAGVTVAAQTAARVRSGRAFSGQRIPLAALLPEADRLARDGGPAAGLLAVALVSNAGGSGDWPQEWRALLRLLRRHPHPDVRYAAHGVFTRSE